MAKDDWITTAEAVTLSGYHIVTLYKLLASDTVKGQKWGRSWMVSRSSLLAYMKRTEKLGAKRGPKTGA